MNWRVKKKTVPLCDRLIAFLEGLNVELDVQLTADIRLFDSGLFDSMALFNLATWVEQEIDKPLDLTEFDLLQEWATVADIVTFIEKHRERTDG